MATVLTIAGTSVSVPSAAVVDKLTVYSKGGVPSLQFAVRGGPLPGEPDPIRSKLVTLTIGGTLYFSGQAVSMHPEYRAGSIGWVRVYTALGLRDYGDKIPHTDSNNGSDTSAYNLSQDNQSLDYLASRAGRTVGQILTDVLTMTVNANALNGYGLMGYTSLTPPTLPSATVSDLAALSLIPPAPVYFGGERLLSAVDSFLETWAPNYVMNIEPNGVMRIRDLRSFSAATLTMGTDPIEPVALSSDTSNCFSRVTIRGSQIAEMYLFSLSNGGLTEDFAHDGLSNSAAKAAWTPSSYCCIFPVVFYKPNIVVFRTDAQSP